MERYAAPCPAEDLRTYRALAESLRLNRDAQLPPTALTACQNKLRASGYEVLMGTAVDDPDRGIDENLDPTPGNPFDPDNDRAWMGGTKGETSKGFRHMYFGGWRMLSPLATFQIPIHAVGQAPERAQLIAEKARELLRKPETRLWGFRVLAWAMHYVQDLGQPFHTVQLPSLRMAPWGELGKWPPTAGFKGLVSETTRTIANYHWAYETLTLKEIEKSETSRLNDCLAQPAANARILADPLFNEDFPRTLALDVVDESVALAPDVGSGLLKLFGRGPMQPGVDLVRDPQGPQAPNYDMVMMDPDLNDSRRSLYGTTCAALSNAILASRQLIAWALR
jgi:hypothetical protein